VAWALSALADKTSRNCDVEAGVGAEALAFTESSLATLLCCTSAIAPFTSKIF
jgi:hypothetical protein